MAWNVVSCPSHLSPLWPAADVDPSAGCRFAISSAPYIINGFIAANVVADIELENWRWGYGMFCIVLPAAFIPLLGVLYWGDWKAKKIGALSIASSSYARRHALEQAQEPKKSYFQLVRHFLNLIDAAGLILFGTALALILLPFTLTENAKGGWHNPSMIAMEVVGWVILIGFGTYEWTVAEFPLLPRRILNRTFLCCAFIDAMYEMGGYIQGEYFSSWCEFSLSDQPCRQPFSHSSLTASLPLAQTT